MTATRDLKRLSTPEVLRTLRERYGIRQAEMARRIDWDIQKYRRYEDPEIQRDGLPGDLYGAVKQVLTMAGASKEEVWHLLPDEIRKELEALQGQLNGQEERLRRVENALKGEGHDLDGATSDEGENDEAANG